MVTYMHTNVVEKTVFVSDFFTLLWICVYLSMYTIEFNLAFDEYIVKGHVNFNIGFRLTGPRILAFTA